MTAVSVVCTVALGAIAAWQSVRLWMWQRTAKQLAAYGLNLEQVLRNVAFGLDSIHVASTAHTLSPQGLTAAILITRGYIGNLGNPGASSAKKSA